MVVELGEFGVDNTVLVLCRDLLEYEGNMLGR